MIYKGFDALIFMRKELIEAILRQKEKRKWELAAHLRLAAFHEIIKDSQLQLDIRKISQYIEQEKEKYPQFTQLISSSIISDIKNKPNFFTHHLPFNQFYHLEFFTYESNLPLVKIFYNSCQGCKKLESESFPYIELRKNTKLKEESQVMMFDNRVSILRQNKDLLEKQFLALEGFINYTKI